MYYNDDTQPIRTGNETMVLAHPGPVQPPAPARRGGKLKTAFLAVVLVAAGAAVGGLAMSSMTYTGHEVERAEQTGYDAGFEAGTSQAEEGVAGAAERAYDSGYRAGFEAGQQQAAQQAAAQEAAAQEAAARAAAEAAAAPAPAAPVAPQQGPGATG